LVSANINNNNVDNKMDIDDDDDNLPIKNMINNKTETAEKKDNEKIEKKEKKEKKVSLVYKYNILFYLSKIKIKFVFYFRIFIGKERKERKKSK
jgi:hypothetical protein